MHATLAILSSGAGLLLQQVSLLATFNSKPQLRFYVLHDASSFKVAALQMKLKNKVHLLLAVRKTKDGQGGRWQDDFELKFVPYLKQRMN